LPTPVIAIVDDDPGMRGSVDSLLRSAGWIGVSFADGAALLESGKQDAINCIITDLHMPDMTGLELQAELTRLGWRQPLIMMTAFPNDCIRARALEGGAQAFLVKPIDPDGLLETVEQAIG
jgi:FixJ family two-component response regulator